MSTLDYDPNTNLVHLSEMEIQKLKVEIEMMKAEPHQMVTHPRPRPSRAFKWALGEDKEMEWCRDNELELNAADIALDEGR